MAEDCLLTPLAIAIGDPAGIGPELLHLSLDRLPRCRVFAPEYLRPSTLPSHLIWESIPGDRVNPGEPSIESGQQAHAAFKKAAQDVVEGRSAALVTLPLAKEWVARSVPGFRGHTETLGEWWGGTPVMMLVGGALRVALVTIHEPLRRIPELVTLDRVLKIGRVLREDLHRWGLTERDREPQLHLLGLNPHAGENGLLGSEEQGILEPALAVLRAEGGRWSGPHAADGFFRQGQFGDAVLAMYHDQGLIPVKMKAEGHGANVTLGLPYWRTSPDHGTAFDIAGRNMASPESFLTAVELAVKGAAAGSAQASRPLS